MLCWSAYSNFPTYLFSAIPRSYFYKINIYIPTSIILHIELDQLLQGDDLLISSLLMARIKSQELYIDNNPTTVSVLTLINEFSCLTHRAQTYRLIGDQFIGWETIMEFNNSNLLRTHFGLSVDLIGSSLTHIVTSNVHQTTTLKCALVVGCEWDGYNLDSLILKIVLYDESLWCQYGASWSIWCGTTL